MSVGGIMFMVATVLCFGLGIFGIIALTIQEYEARQALPAEMQTPEAIEIYYDGSVLIYNDMFRIVIAFFSFGFGTILLLCWGIYEWFRAGRQDLTKLFPRD